MRITFLVSVSYKYFYKKYINHYTCYKIPIGKSIKISMLFTDFKWRTKRNLMTENHCTKFFNGTFSISVLV